MKKNIKQKDQHPPNDLHELSHEELSGSESDEHNLATLSLSEDDEDENEGTGDGNMGSNTRRMRDEEE